jgi:hypothetical protein
MGLPFEFRRSSGRVTPGYASPRVEQLNQGRSAPVRRKPFRLLTERRCRGSLALHAALIGLLGPSSPAAHSWYPVWCCSERDCRELSEEKGETVSEAQDGWHLWDGRLVGRGIAKPSPDKKFHICEEPTTRAIICFFAPPGAT